MIIPTARAALVLSLTGLVIASGSGCEDATAKQRDDTQAQIIKIRNDLQKAVAGGAATPEAYQDSLNKIAAQAGGLKGDPGQQSAGALMAADALRESAAVSMAQAADIESKHRSTLRITNARLESIARIQTLASGLGSIDAGQRRTELQAELDKAHESAQALQAQLKQVEGPIAERTAENEKQRQEVERLRVQVGELVKKWQEMGYSAGFDTYRHSADVGRQADKLEYEISQREIELEHSLNPQQKMAQTQLAQVEALGQAIEKAQGELDAFVKAAAGDAQASRTKAGELGKQVADDLNKIKSESDGDLKSAYDGALASLDKAAASAQASSRGGDAKAARTLTASIQESIARVHLAAANGLADRAATLERAKANGDAVHIDGLDAQLRQTTDDRQKHVDDAKAAIESAKQAIEAGGTGGEIESLRSGLQSLTDSMEGKHAIPAASDAAGGGASEMPEPAGAESPESLAEVLKSVKTPMDAGRMFEVTTLPSDPDQRSAMNALRSLFAGVSALDQALQAKFKWDPLESTCRHASLSIL